MHRATKIRREDESNPFAHPLAWANSAATTYHAGMVTALNQERPIAPLERKIHLAFRAFVLDPAFSCVGAKSALHRGGYRLGVYPAMASAAATAGLARDLCAFTRKQDDGDTGDTFTTFVACFTAPDIAGEEEFEHLLWDQIQALHDLDRRHHRWDPLVSADPADPAFSFSFAGHAYFVVGLHPASSRLARRFAWPALAFNAHRQFTLLRAQGRYGRMQEVIRARERRLQGSINPVLCDFGTRSEARQYAGRAVGAAWRCPLRIAAPDVDGGGDAR